jgi:hypothetical protein
MKKHLSPKFAVLACAVAALLVPAAAKADANIFAFHLDFDVTSLVNNASGPFYLDFLLTEGSVPTNELNTVSIRNFTFQGTGAGPLGSANVAGDGTVTGSMGVPPITLTDSGTQGTSAELYQQFTAGTTHIAFDVFTTQNLLGLTPDGVSVSLLDNTAANIPTSDPNGSVGSNWTMAHLDIGGNNNFGDIQTYTSSSPDGGATVAVSVPEPSSVAALLGGAGLLLGLRRRRA